MTDIEYNLKKLIENNWLSKNEAEKYFSDNNIIRCINSCTSPEGENIFNALTSVPLNKLRAVILGQDPYPNPNHAHGLAFSSRDKTTPESLKNIFRAIDSTYGSNLLNNGKNELTGWVEQGVLLLNTSLTYHKYEDEKCEKKLRDKKQQAIQKEHLKIWKPFINTVIKKILSVNNHPAVMFLWGNSAHDIVFGNIKDKEFKIYLHSREAVIVPGSTIMLLQASHPSPLSVNRGGDFLTTVPKHLKACENYLANDKIDWTKL